MAFLFLLSVVLQADTSYSVQMAIAPAESLRVTVAGAGDPVVLLPGLFGSAYSYRRVTKILSATGHQSIVIEPLGMGSSSRPDDADYSLAAQADRVAAVLDTLGVDDAVFVAHAVGASIVFRTAYRHPELTHGIISIEGGPGETATTKGFRRWMRLAPAARMLDPRGMVLRLIYRDMKKVSADDSWVSPEIVLAYTEGLVADFKQTVKAYQGMAKSKEPERLEDHLDAIPCPVILLVGDKKHDSGPSKEEVALLAERLPIFSVDTVPESGFFIQEEQPAAVTSAVEGIMGGPGCAGSD